jgi:hypothetical protein
MGIRKEMIRTKKVSNRISKGLQCHDWFVLGVPFSVGRKNCFSVVCQCKCGNITVIQCRTLVGKNCSKSCIRCATKGKNTKHGDAHAGNRLYNIWAKMIERCYNKKRPAYKNYGGRGIRVSKVWRWDYTKFKTWALLNGYSDNLELDRKDNNKGYKASNCRWVSNKVNARNKRNNRLITCFGETKCLAAWGEDKRCKVSWMTLQKRLDSNWTIKKAITTPKKF